MHRLFKCTPLSLSLGVQSRYRALWLSISQLSEFCRLQRCSRWLFSRWRFLRSVFHRYGLVRCCCVCVGCSTLSALLTWSLVSVWFRPRWSVHCLMLHASACLARRIGHRSVAYACSGDLVHVGLDCELRIHNRVSPACDWHSIGNGSVSSSDLLSALDSDFHPDLAFRA